VDVNGLKWYEDARLDHLDDIGMALLRTKAPKHVSRGREVDMTMRDGKKIGDHAGGYQWIVVVWNRVQTLRYQTEHVYR